MTARGDGSRYAFAWFSIVYMFVVAVIAHVALYRRGHLQPLKTWNPWFLAAPLWTLPLRFVLIEFRELGWVTLRCDVKLTLEVLFVLCLAGAIITNFYRIIWRSIWEQQKVDFGKQYLANGAALVAHKAALGLNAAGAGVGSAAVGGGNTPRKMGGAAIHAIGSTTPRDGTTATNKRKSNVSAISSAAGPKGPAPAGGADEGLQIDPHPAPNAANTVAAGGAAGSADPQPKSGEFDSGNARNSGGADGHHVLTLAAGGGPLYRTTDFHIQHETLFKSPNINRRLLIGSIVSIVLVGCSLLIFLLVDKSHAWSTEYECGYYNNGMYVLIGELTYFWSMANHMLYLFYKHRATLVESFGMRKLLTAMVAVTFPTEAITAIIILVNGTGESFDRTVLDPWWFYHFIMFVYPLMGIAYPVYQTYTLRQYNYRKGAGPAAPHHTKGSAGDDSHTGTRTGVTGTTKAMNKVQRVSNSGQTTGTTIAVGAAGGTAGAEHSGGGVPRRTLTISTPGHGGHGGATNVAAQAALHPNANPQINDRLSIALVKVLLDPTAFSKFVQYSQSEFNAESCLFWSGVEQYRVNPTSDGAARLFATFLSETAPMQVNLSFQTMQRIRNDINQLLTRGMIGAAAPLTAGGAFKSGEDTAADPTLFDIPQREIFLMMRSDVFPRFRASKLGQSCANVWQTGDLDLYVQHTGHTPQTPALHAQVIDSKGHHHPPSPNVGGAMDSTIAINSAPSPAAGLHTGGGGGYRGSTVMTHAPLMNLNNTTPTSHNHPAGTGAGPHDAQSALLGSNTPVHILVARRMTAGVMISQLHGAAPGLGGGDSPNNGSGVRSGTPLVGGAAGGGGGSGGSGGAAGGGVMVTPRGAAAAAAGGVGAGGGTGRHSSSSKPPPSPSPRHHTGTAVVASSSTVTVPNPNRLSVTKPPPLAQPVSASPNSMLPLPTTTATASATPVVGALSLPVITGTASASTTPAGGVAPVAAVVTGRLSARSAAAAAAAVPSTDVQMASAGRTAPVVGTLT